MSRTLGALHPHKVLRLSLVLWRFWLANPDLVIGAGMDSFHSCLVVSSIIFNWMCDVTWRTSLCSSSAGRVHTVHIWLWPIIQSRPFPATKPIMRWLVGGRAAGTTNGDSSDHILPHTLPLACPAAGQRLVIIISVVLLLPPEGPTYNLCWWTEGGRWQDRELCNCRSCVQCVTTWQIMNCNAVVKVNVLSGSCKVSLFPPVNPWPAPRVQ